MIRNVKKIDVFYSGMKVGTLVEYEKSRTAFQYDSKWVKEGFSISPFSLPLSDEIFYSPQEPFNGLFGVFSDHLPDGWGRLLQNRYLLKHGTEPSFITELTRLTLLASDSFGGLEFMPSQFSGEPVSDMDFESLYEASQLVLMDYGSEEIDLDDLFLRGGSSGGARPKINVLIDGDLYLVKFPMSMDGRNMGRMEYDYLCAAKKCGIEVAECRLLESRSTSGFLATKRFDRPCNRIRPHMISLSGLLESSHRIPALDYGHLFKTASILSNSKECLMQVFRLMCFNVFSGNQDDHGKNFTFMRTLDEDWKLSPAYDLTKCVLPYGERSTTVNRKGKNITDDDLLSYASAFCLPLNELKMELDRIKETVHMELYGYLE